MKYILDYTSGESFDYSSEKVEELKAFGHRYEVIEAVVRGSETMELFHKDELTNYNYRTGLIEKHEYTS